MSPIQRCLFCGREFIPNPRITKQKACPRKACQKARHDQAHARWRRANPDIYRGVYANTRRWLDKHPGYLQCYRAKHPDYVTADHRARVERKRGVRRRRSDIRDAFHRRKIEVIRRLRGSDIQDTFRLQIDGVLGYLEQPVGPIYETR